LPQKQETTNFSFPSTGLMCMLVVSTGRPHLPELYTFYSPSSITPTLRQSPRQVPDKVADTNHESPWHKSHRRLTWFVSTTLSGTCLKLCRGLSPCIV